MKLSWLPKEGASIGKDLMQIDDVRPISKMTTKISSYCSYSYFVINEPLYPSITKPFSRAFDRITPKCSGLMC